MTSTDGLKQLFTAAIFAMLIFARSTVADEWPGREWATNTPAAAGLDQALMQKARDYAMTGGGAGCIIRGGKLVLAWGDQKARYDLKSTTKSFGATALGVAILDGKVALEDTAKSHYPGLGTPAGEQLPDRLARPDHDPATGHADGRASRSPAGSSR